MEPRNSWEISYVILTRKPNAKVQIPYAQVVKQLSYQRMAQLREWAYDNFSYKWYVEHI